jgi:hypothetical protein
MQKPTSPYRLEISYFDHVLFPSRCIILHIVGILPVHVSWSGRYV